MTPGWSSWKTVRTPAMIARIPRNLVSSPTRIAFRPTSANASASANESEHLEELAGDDAALREDLARGLGGLVHLAAEVRGARPRRDLADEVADREHHERGDRREERDAPDVRVARQRRPVEVEQDERGADRRAGVEHRGEDERRGVVAVVLDLAHDEALAAGRRAREPRAERLGQRDEALVLGGRPVDQQREEDVPGERQHAAEQRGRDRARALLGLPAERLADGAHRGGSSLGGIAVRGGTQSRSSRSTARESRSPAAR